VEKKGGAYIRRGRISRTPRYVPGYYNTVNKGILIIANKRIHIISAYFLAAATISAAPINQSLWYALRKCSNDFTL